MQWIIGPLKNYAVFEGRARRTEFWSFFLVVAGATLLAQYVDALDGVRVPVAAGMGVIEFVVFLMLLLPLVTSGVRRLHDTDRSGWWSLLLYLPYLGWIASQDNQKLMLVSAGALFIGFIALAIPLILPGTPGANRFGNNPRGFADN
jgi:uncharacterized membrane protein YhaH (DUF805 family)